MLRKYEQEIKHLRSELQSKSQDVADKRRLLQVRHRRARKTLSQSLGFRPVPLWIL